MVYNLFSRVTLTSQFLIPVIVAVVLWLDFTVGMANEYCCTCWDHPSLSDANIFHLIVNHKLKL